MERLADELGADGQAALRETTGDADRGQTGEIHPDRVDVAEIEGERVGFFPELERGHRRGRRQERVDLAEGVEKILPDERADFLRAEVVGVVVAGAEHVGAEDDAALHFGTETFGARLGVNVHGVLRRRRAVAVTDAVVAAEIRGGFGGRDDVVGVETVLGVRKRDFADFAALGPVKRDGLFDRCRNFGIEALREIFLGDAQFPRAAVDRERGAVIGNVRFEGGRVAFVVPGDGAEHDGGVLDGAGKRADLVERRGERDESVARDEAVAGLQPDDAAERGRLADGAAGVGAERGDGFARGECGRTAARGTAGDARGVPRIAGRAKGGIFRRGPHGELIAVEPAPQDRAGLLQLRRNRRVIGRDEVLQHLARGRERLAGDRDDVFQSDRDAVEGAAGLPGGATGVGRGGLRQRVGRVEGVEGVDAGLDGLGARDDGLRKFDGGELLRVERGGEVGDGPEMEGGGHGGGAGETEGGPRSALLDDFRDGDHVVALGRSVAEGVGDGEAGLRDVGLPDVEDGRGVGGGFDAGDVDFRQLLDVVQDVAELLRKFRFLFGREREAGELGDVVDVELGRGGHGYLRICQGVVAATSSCTFWKTPLTSSSVSVRSAERKTREKARLFLPAGTPGPV